MILTTKQLANVLAFNPGVRDAVAAAARAERRSLDAWSAAAAEFEDLENGEAIAAELAERLELVDAGLSGVEEALRLQAEIPGRIARKRRGRR